MVRGDSMVSKLIKLGLAGGTLAGVVYILAGGKEARTFVMSTADAGFKLASVMKDVKAGDYDSAKQNLGKMFDSIEELKKAVDQRKQEVNRVMDVSKEAADKSNINSIKNIINTIDNDADEMYTTFNDLYEKGQQMFNVKTEKINIKTEKINESVTNLEKIDKANENHVTKLVKTVAANTKPIVKKMKDEPTKNESMENNFMEIIGEEVEKDVNADTGINDEIMTDLVVSDASHAGIHRIFQRYGKMPNTNEGFFNWYDKLTQELEKANQGSDNKLTTYIKDSFSAYHKVSLEKAQEKYLQIRKQVLEDRLMRDTEKLVAEFESNATNTAGAENVYDEEESKLIERAKELGIPENTFMTRIARIKRNIQGVAADASVYSRNVKGATKIQKISEFKQKTKHVVGGGQGNTGVEQQDLLRRVHDNKPTKEVFNEGIGDVVDIGKRAISDFGHVPFFGEY